jgi:hypothetical protein
VPDSPFGLGIGTGPAIGAIEAESHPGAVIDLFGIEARAEEKSPFGTAAPFPRFDPFEFLALANRSFGRPGKGTLRSQLTIRTESPIDRFFPHLLPPALGLYIFLRPANFHEFHSDSPLFLFVLLRSKRHAGGMEREIKLKGKRGKRLKRWSFFRFFGKPSACRVGKKWGRNSPAG